MASMGTPGGGRSEIDPRFAALFAVFNITFPKETSLLRIYSNILQGHTSIFSDSIKQAIVKLTPATLQLFAEVSKSFIIFSIFEIFLAFMKACAWLHPIISKDLINLYDYGEMRHFVYSMIDL
jgi:hypothetical protein